MSKLASLNELIKIRGSSLISSKDRVTEEVNERTKNRDLLFFSYKNWYLWNEDLSRYNKKYKDDNVYFTDKGVFTSKSLIHDQGLNLSENCEFSWDHINKLWSVKNLSESIKADSLLSMINNLTVKSNSEVSEIVSSIEKLKRSDAINIFEIVLDNIVCQLSKENCIREDMEYSEDRYTLCSKIQEDVVKNLEQLKLCIREIR